MHAASAASAPVRVPVESDGREEVAQLVRRPRGRRGDPMLPARGDHLKMPSQGSQPPQRPVPIIPTAGGHGERMLSVQEIRLSTQPSKWPAPTRPAPTLPVAATAVPPAGGVTPEPGLERLRPAPLTTAPIPVAELSDDEWHTPPGSPYQLPSPTSLTVPLLLLPPPLSPSSPEARAPEVPRREGKQPMPPSPPASTSAVAPEATEPVSPTEALRPPDKLAHVGELANQLAEPLDKLWGLRVPGLPPFHYMDRDALVNANHFLTRHEHLLDMKDLRHAQDCLRDLLDHGVQEGRLPGVSESRLGGLRLLSEVDLMSLTKPLRQFKAGFAEIYDEVVNVRGGDPNWFRQRARPIEDIEAERAARIAADNEALRLGHYTF